MLELNLKYFNHAKITFHNFQGTPNQNQLYNDELENLFKVKNLQLDKITQKQKDIALLLKMFLKTFKNLS